MKDLLEKRALFYYKNKKYVEAIECYKHLIKDGNNSTDIYLALAACYYYAENYEKAILTLNKILLLDNTGVFSEYACAWKAMSLMMLKKYDESYKVWKKLENAGEDIRDENYYFCGASCCNSLGRYEEALEYINKSIFLKKTDFYNFYLKGTILNNLGRTKEALKMFEKAGMTKSSE